MTKFCPAILSMQIAIAFPIDSETIVLDSKLKVDAPYSTNIVRLLNYPIIVIVWEYNKVPLKYSITR